MTEDEDLSAAQKRKKYLYAESTLHAVGWWFLGGVIAAVVFIAALSFALPGPGLRAYPVARAAGLAVYCAATAAVGVGILLKKPWSYWPMWALLGLGVLNFPMGTLFAYFAWSRIWPTGRYLFSDEHLENVSETPGIDMPFSPLLALAAAPLVLGLLFVASLFLR